MSLREIKGGPMTKTQDQPARNRALSIAESFIVQAPAGSGKTELLIQRYLALLGQVDTPEEILAITFTRKAAGEMRERILLALDEAAEAQPPTARHKRVTRELACRALARNEENGWQLLESPSRLRVMTIDAFNGLLSRYLPLLSKTGGTVRVSDDPGQLYREAARRTLRTAGENSEHGQSAYRLLQHLDNDFLQAERMLMSLLARRDHWLSHIVGQSVRDESDSRSILEKSIRNQVVLSLQKIASHVAASIGPDLPRLAAYAAKELAEQEIVSPICACLDLSGYPAADADALPVWRGLAEVLLTKANGWRKSLNKNSGFPPRGKIEKEEMTTLLDGLLGDDFLRQAVAELRRLPDPVYSDQQWRILGALISMLPYSVAELEATFRSRGETDYVAVSQAAHLAMGEVDDPGDLALAMDYRLHHILVDEFQDTSRSQVALLEKLVAGWEHGDGRTLFCVGDPMQSIYGFREANVGLYLKARHDGLGDTTLEPLQLMANFRSDHGLVEWVNKTFADVLPDKEDLRSGAVPFVHAQPTLAADHEPPIVIQSLVGEGADCEAALVLETIEDIRCKYPRATIAILVRARTHLVAIAPLLRNKGVSFQAVEIEKLDQSPAVQDLMSLTRSLCHAGDRTAWLALLRAPFCGLQLSDLLVLSQDRDRTLWDVISDDAAWQNLSDDAVSRLTRIRDVLDTALAEKGRRRLHRLVEGAWVALGGAAVNGETELEDARSFFSLLSRLDTGGDLDDVSGLEQELEALFASPDAGAGPELQLMTIHKAKGLQFDHVILPGLQRTVRRGSKSLLHWLEPLREGQGADLLLAGAAEKGAQADPLQDYLAHLENQREDLELGRLLYVAVTRACHRLHLFAQLTPELMEGTRSPSTGSFLSLLWPTMSAAFKSGRIEVRPDAASAVDESRLPCMRRINVDWKLPLLPSIVIAEMDKDPGPRESDNIQFDWAGRSRRAIGIAVHRMLERIASDGVDSWDERRIVDNKATIRSLLIEAGVSSGELDASYGIAYKALTNTLSDERGRWILSSGHRDVGSEIPLAGVVDGETLHVVLDRSFVDSEGTRWIVDFKTGQHGGADLQGFLDEEQERYGAQLNGYARLLSGLKPKEPVRVALYYPMHREWREWTPVEAN
jgi:ATP-dependent helicase/nuclease subunit A